MSGFLLVIGFIVNAIAGLMILIRAFKVSVGWGLACMFVPFASLFFVIKNWDETKGPFLAGIGGGVIMFMGVVFGAMTATPTAPEPATTVASKGASYSDDDDEEDGTSYASAAATPASYEPPRSSYTPSTSSTPSYNPAPVPAGTPAPAVTETQEPDDLWTRRPKYEQVYVDRATNLYYADKCKKLPENVYRIPKALAISQGFEEAKCR